MGQSISNTGTASWGSPYQRGVARKTLHTIAAQSAWGCRKDNFRNRYSTVRWNCRRFRSRHTNSSNVGSPKCRFGIGPQYIIYRMRLPGENVFWNRRIIIDRFGLLGHRFWGHWTSHFLGLLEHHFWGRWTSSSPLGICRNITSSLDNIAVWTWRPLFLASLHHHYCIARRTSSFSGGAPTFR